MHEGYVEGEQEPESEDGGKGEGRPHDAIGVESREAGVSAGRHGESFPSQERAGAQDGIRGSQDGVKRKKVGGGEAQRITVCIEDSDDDCQ